MNDRDLISRGALSKWCHETMSAQTTTVGVACIRDFWNKVLDAPAVDAVEVVRCKDCDRRNKSADLTDTVYCGWFRTQMRKVDFCSYGERREDG